ncbi:unnamed protein product [Chrysoparadoxa australica]
MAIDHSMVQRARRDQIEARTWWAGCHKLISRLCDQLDTKVQRNGRATPDQKLAGYLEAILSNPQFVKDSRKSWVGKEWDKKEAAMRPRFYNAVKSVVLESQKALEAAADLRKPHLHYPLARIMKRKIIYHAGPTNSGKTYTAIERLKQAGPEGGLFCGPLRLLALEIYETLNTAGIYCNLYTGQDKREVPFATHTSCTIEMASMQREFDVAVIDEIQMVGNKQRGAAWTKALLGLRASEIHVCGGVEAVGLVRRLVTEAGDDFSVVTYERKTPLHASDTSLKGNYSAVQPGDCIVAFNKPDIFAIKKEIETSTKHRCCVVYGQLPSETRSYQAKLFNEDGSGYDILVASDAIGMGLNLNIRRIIFHTVLKRTNSTAVTQIEPTLLKQIAGRAGRLRSDWDFGEVTSYQQEDLPYIKEVLSKPLEPVQAAGIFPSVEQVEEFLEVLLEHDKMEGPYRLSSVIDRMVRISKLDKRYFMQEHDQMAVVADLLHKVHKMSLADRFEFCMAPLNTRDKGQVNVLASFAKAVSERKPTGLNVLLPGRDRIPKNVDQLGELCSSHNILDLYMWLSTRFPGFVEQVSKLAAAVPLRSPLLVNLPLIA